MELEEKKNKKEVKEFKYNYMNLRYRNLLLENKKMKEELERIKNKNKLNEEMNKIQSKRKPNINIKKNNFIIKDYIIPNIDEEKKKRQLLEENKLKEQIQKIKDEKLKKNKIDEEKEFKELNNKKNKISIFGKKNQNGKNKSIIIDEDKIKLGINNLNQKNRLITEKNEKKNERILLDENKIRLGIKKINDKNKLNEIDIKNIKYLSTEKNKILKELKKNKSTLNGDSVSDKLKNKQNDGLIKRFNERNQSYEKDEIKLNDNVGKEKKIKFKLKTNKSDKIEKSYGKLINNADLKNILNKSYLFSDKNSENNTKNLVEKLELILDLDRYLKNEIKINKDDNLILPEEAVYYIENVIIRFLGYFGSELTLRNIKTYIEKNPTNFAIRELTFKIISSGLTTEKIYKLIVENEEIKMNFSKDNEKYINFVENIKLKIANKYKISENNIFFFGNNLKNFELYLIIYNHKLDGVENLLKEYNLKATSSLLLNNAILSSNIFESDFSKGENDWPKKNLMRGGKKYYPPYGWIGIGLRLKNKFGKANSSWFGKENNEGEWPVAYHGVGKGNVLQRCLKIINGNLKEEVGKIFKNEKNVEKNNNKYPYCGEGVYFSPNIEDAAYFADKTSLGYFNIKFQFAIMARVNPNKIRSPGSLPVEWILNPNNDEIRPYRLLIKITSV